MALIPVEEDNKVYIKHYTAIANDNVSIPSKGHCSFVFNFSDGTIKDGDGNSHGTCSIIPAAETIIFVGISGTGQVLVEPRYCYASYPRVVNIDLVNEHTAALSAKPSLHVITISGTNVSTTWNAN